LRNPLAGIVTSAQVLSMLPPDDPDREKMQAVIQRQAGHMVRMVDDLLDVSRIARGKLTLERSPLDFVQLVRQALDDYRQGHINDDLEVETELPAEPVWISGDATRLQQVLTNLIHNACKFTEGPCRLRVQVIADASRRLAVLLLRDYGVGMTRETLARIFEPFNQAEYTIDRSRGGMGLGLALVKGLVSLHKGRIAARSEGLGKGSEFVIELPLETPVTLPGPSAEPIEPPARCRRVLLIDDTKDALFPLERMLSVAGMDVSTALDGPSGLEKAREFRPDVVLCDIGLPGMDGYAVAAALREDPVLHEVYLVAVTGYGQEEDRRMAQEAGFDYHLTKPVSKANLDLVMTVFPRFDEQPLAVRG
jgi:CheY-like chemotaxis protein